MTWARRHDERVTAKIATTAIPVVTSSSEAIGVAREFAASIASGVIERDRAGTVPARELAGLDASGLLGITVPGEHGGADLPPSTLAEVIRVIAAVDPAIAQVPQSHFLFVDVLAAAGTPHQRLRLLGDVLAGARLANGLAERGGQHAQDLKTRLSGTGSSDLRLTGRKYYCTGALTARWLGVSALDASDRLVLAFVERDSPGVHLDDDWNVMGQRATVSGSAQFDDVPVDPRLVVPYSEVFEKPQQFGEGDEVRDRLAQHARSEEQGGKDFWERAIVLTSKDATDPDVPRVPDRTCEGRLGPPCIR